MALRAAWAKVLTEFIGTAVLVCVVVGSGIMGTDMSTDNGVALLINALSTVFALALLILILAPVSGAHLNPAVSLVELTRRTIPPGQTVAYIVAQILGAIAGALTANAIYNDFAFQWGTHDRVSIGTLLGELIATAGLIIVIGALVLYNKAVLIPVAVALWIGSAYFFTSSTSFANPAVTVGRMFTDSFAGISPASVLPFIGAQLVGAFIGLGMLLLLGRAQKSVLSMRP